MAGKINMAVQFDGSADFVTLNSSTLQGVTNTSFSLEAWVSPQDLPPTTCGTNSNTCGYGVMMKPGYHSGLVYMNTGQYSADIWNSSNQKFKLHLYVDGKEVSGSPVSYTGTLRNFGTSPFYVGSGNPTASSWKWMFKGTIDEAGIYNRALSAADVLSRATK
ncbi:MAG: LamG domain-containing protein [Nitrospirae bacterium]|nr:MAG: LamG domain-containing protein [Nitrospirota bacterium]